MRLRFMKLFISAGASQLRLMRREERKLTLRHLARMPASERFRPRTDAERQEAIALRVEKRRRRAEVRAKKWFGVTQQERHELYKLRMLQRIEQRAAHLVYAYLRNQPRSTPEPLFLPLGAKAEHKLLKLTVQYLHQFSGVDGLGFVAHAIRFKEWYGPMPFLREDAEQVPAEQSPVPEPTPAQP